jgi:hypothetical protein
MKKNLQKTSEWIWNLLGYTFILVGATLAIISLIGDYLPVASELNWVLIAEGAVIEFTSLNYDFLFYGIFFVILGTLTSVLSLVVYADREQNEIDKATRRANRLAETLQDS